MTSAQFYSVLEEVKDSFKWNTDKNDLGSIRGLFKNGVAGCFCPITAVAYRVLGEKYTDIDVDIASKKLGLNENFAISIVDASDNVGSKKVRRHLLRAIGVK